MPMTHPYLLCLWRYALVFAFVVAAPAGLRGGDPRPDDVVGLLRRSADLHLQQPSGIALNDWIIAPLYDGLVRLAIATDDPKYLAAVLEFGRQSGWKPRWRPYHADDQAVGHAWLDVFLMDRSHIERLEPIKAHLDNVLSNPVREDVGLRRRTGEPGRPTTDRWTWCDALYMAPPTLTRLYTATGDPRYLEFLDQEFRYCYKQLYDRDARLFYRDARFIDQRTPGGHKVFWGRGNGWVFGGLALLLEHLPPAHPTREFYTQLFRDMSRSVLATQQPDGLWRPSLLDPDQFPLGETSGSGLFVFGLAWGLNHGLLDPDVFRPALFRGWHGLVTRVQPNGFVGFVQPPGSAPGQLSADSGHDYGTGAFLLAGSEVLRVLGAAASPDCSALLRRAEQLEAATASRPRAYARLMRERKEAVAWENDRVAFRIYGPDLRASGEGGGGVWSKRVPYPVINMWYDAMLAGQSSDHKDTGEGFDGYKVGDSLGCGGTALWLEDRMVTADVYQFADVYWTALDRAEVRAIYEYPVEYRGGRIFEYRTIRLRMGQRLCEVSSTFSSVGGKNIHPIAGFDVPVVVGLVTQSPSATIVLDPGAGLAAVHDDFAGYLLHTGVVADPADVLRMERAPHLGEPKGATRALVFLRPDANSTVHYRTGFAWTGDGENTTEEHWRDHLRTVGMAAARRSQATDP